jgi:hypothetical protein
MKTGENLKEKSAVLPTLGHLTPVEVAEALIAPGPTLCQILGYHPKSCYSWRYPSSMRDAGDFPSARIQRALLDYSEKHYLNVDPRWLISGAPVKDVIQVLVTRGNDASEILERLPAHLSVPVAAE